MVKTICRTPLLAHLSGIEWPSSRKNQVLIGKQSVYASSSLAFPLFGKKYFHTNHLTSSVPDTWIRSTQKGQPG